MNVRMSQGQATRSTFTLARVTHFIAASERAELIKPRIAPEQFRGGIAVGTLYGIDHELLAPRQSRD